MQPPPFTPLQLAYLIIEGAIAAWIPLLFEIAGSIMIIILKVCTDAAAVLVVVALVLHLLRWLTSSLLL